MASYWLLQAFEVGLGLRSNFNTQKFGANSGTL